MVMFLFSQIHQAAIRWAPGLRSLCLGLLSLALAGQLFALEWERDRLKLSCTTADEEVLGVFHYTNKGQEPVRILEVTTGCDCARPVFPKTDLRPGESGTLSVAFRVGGRTGLQQRHLEVRTTEQGDQLRRLDFEVDILELLEVRPRLVFWKKDLPPEPRIVRLKLSLPGKTRLVSAKPDSTGFSCEWRVDDESKGLHHLIVLPGSTGNIQQGQLRVSYEHEGKPLETILFLAVR